MRSIQSRRLPEACQLAIQLWLLVCTLTLLTRCIFMLSAGSKSCRDRMSFAEETDATNELINDEQVQPLTSAEIAQMKGMGLHVSVSLDDPRGQRQSALTDTVNRTGDHPEAD